MTIDKKRLQELAGIVNEADDRDLVIVADHILKMATEEAYNDAAEFGTKVTHDQILKTVQDYLERISDEIEATLRKDFQK